MTEYLQFKWGTLKGWGDLSKNEKACAALNKWGALGVSMSTMTQAKTPAHIEAMCELIDAVNGPLYNDWAGTEMSKDEAKKYIREYGSR